jgi:tetratricopeptide (TPR) repeat protein
MRQRVAEPHLREAGRRVEVIAAIERRLAQHPKDEAAQELKAKFYDELTEADYEAAVEPGKAAHHFDHLHVHEKGLALLADPQQWKRGAEYLRIAARGMPEAGPSLYVRIAKACQQAGEFRDAWHNYELAKQAGKKAGPQNLSQEDRDLYFHVVKMLADSARDDGDVEKAIENYRLYTEAPAADVETYRTLADLYERHKDVWSALHATEHAMIHGKKSDPDLLARKDRYYYSITPEELKQRWESVQNWFDFDYCVRKARALLERHGNDMELIDWASHLVELAHTAQPSNLTVRLLRARVRRLRGEIPEAIELLEGIRADRPERFASNEEEESWYTACKLLGDLYINDKPDVALQCFLEYKKYPKSGADTFYKLGMAYEALGDWTRAARCYEQVTAYESHPLAPAAFDALDRLRTASG